MSTPRRIRGPEWGARNSRWRLSALAHRVKPELLRYLKPDAQEQLLATPKACLAVIELAVNWEAEKLYAVEGLGPLDEF